uniref:AAA family ATPase n=1 Tax=Pseudomonas putida TaxID=303 RepID=UPI0039058B97
QSAKNHIISSFIVEILDVELKVSWTQNRVISFEATCKRTGKTHELAAKRITESGSLVPLKVVGAREITINNEKRLLHYDILRSQSLNFMFDFIRQYHHASKKNSTIKEKLSELPLSHGETLLQNLKILFSDDKHFLKKLELHSEEILNTTFFYLAIRNITKLWTAIDLSLKNFFEGVRYSGPLRAAGERFYRYQDLEIDEIDHTGGNLPMVIASLKPREKEQLSEWIKESFGFELELASQGLHYELLIKEESDKDFHNISDMGFGYSQVLPVIVSIWLEIVQTSNSRIRSMLSKRKKWPRILILEQPELHLHPALQYKFGESIAKVATLAKLHDVIFIIETHSKHLIDAIGQSIREDELDETSVNIALFEKSDYGITETSLSGFDNEGYLVNWPIGFLSA